MLVLEIAAGILLALFIVENADKIGGALVKLSVLLALCSPIVILLARGYVVTGFVYMCAFIIGLAVWAFVRSQRATSSTSPS